MEKVLIVDDEPDIVRQLKRVIKKEGFEVLTASNGREALEVFKNELPGLVISDIAMPEINGIELLRRIKTFSPLTEVIMVTGHGDYDTAINVLQKEALDYLKKPLDLEMLLVALNRYLEKTGVLRQEFFRPTVLLLDDDEITRNSMSRCLKKEGYEIISGANGEEGLQIMKQQRIDVVLTDIIMPKMDGLELLKEINDIPGETEVILVTGCGNEDMVVDALHKGANNFLRKPIDIEHMVIAVDKAYEKVNLKRALARKSRDLELTQHIMAKLTRRGDVVIDLRDMDQVHGQEIGQRLFDLAILPIMAVDCDMKCVYANKFFMDIFKGDFFEIETFWDKRLPQMGIYGFSYETFTKKVQDLFRSDDNCVEIITFTQYSYIVFTKLNVLLNERELRLVSAVFRGERKIS